MVSAKILREILDASKRFYSNGIDTVFLKPGGFLKAKEDFQRIRPVGVRTTDENGVVSKYTALFLIYVPKWGG